MIEDSVIEVLFDIPKCVKDGLVSGTMVRTGGVIQNKENGQVVCWLREIGEKVGDPNPVNSTIPADALAGELACGFGLVIAVQLACTYYLAQKIEHLEEKIDKLHNEIITIKGQIEKLHIEHLIDTVKPYYEAYAAFKEEDYAESYRLSRKARADIMTYIIKMSPERLFSDKNGFMLLIKTLINSIVLQLECAKYEKPKKLDVILSNCIDDLKNIKSIMKAFVDEFKKCVIPKSKEHLQAFVNLTKDIELSEFRKHGLSAGIKRLEQEIEISEMLEQVDKKEINKQKLLGKQAVYLIPNFTVKNHVEMLTGLKATIKVR